MELSVYVDGKFYPQSEAKVSVFDHGLLYGDGVFEGIRAYNGRVFKLDRHLDRLYHSAKAIDLKIPHTKEEMANIILETCRRNEIREGYIRPVITRGKGDLGLDPRKCKSGPSVVVIAQPGLSLYGKVYERGLKVVTSSYRRVPPQSLSPSIKSLNYLNNIMARVEANQYGADEALMLDIHGYVSEATAENFFIIRNSTIVTPWTSTNLPGVTRETVLEIVPQLGLKAEERLFTLYDVWSADEAFISGTAAEIGPVVELDGRTIGDGKPGPTTKKIMKAFRDLVMTTGTPIEIAAHVAQQRREQRPQVRVGQRVAERVPPGDVLALEVVRVAQRGGQRRHRGPDHERDHPDPDGAKLGRGAAHGGIIAPPARGWRRARPARPHSGPTRPREHPPGHEGVVRAFPAP